MKRFLSAISLMFVVVTLMVTNLAAPAVAGDVAAGQNIFVANCAACHIGGGNVVNAAKTLKQDDLKANGKDTVAAVVTQVTNGNGAMPAFGGKLSAEEIENVASYVLDQSQKGW